MTSAHWLIGDPPDTRESDGRPMSYLVTCVTNDGRRYVTTATWLGRKYKSPWLCHDTVVAWCLKPDPYGENEP